MPENCSSMPVSSQPLPGARHSRPVAIVTALDEVLRDALVASLLLDAEGLLALRYEVVEDSSALRRLVVAAGGVREHELVDLAHPAGVGARPRAVARRRGPPRTLARGAGRQGVRGAAGVLRLP